MTARQREQLVQENWAHALATALAKFGETPIYDEVAGEFGDVLSVGWRCA